jgi:hypothetical protein
LKGSDSRATRDFSKELTDYCREKRRNRLLGMSLVERWLVSAEERGLARRREGGDGAVKGRWEVTDRGRAQAGFVPGLFQTVGGVSGTLGLASFLIALYADHISHQLRPIAIVAIAYLVCLLGGLIAGRVLAERSRTLLRKVAERERLVQASNPSEVTPRLDT